MCKHNSMRTKDPLVAAELHPIKNAFSAEDVTASSGKSAVWQCRACSHVWTARIVKRVTQGNGCPVSSRCLIVCAKKRHPTLADSNDPLLAEWDRSRNAALGNSPENTTPGSQKKVFWPCPNCSAEQEHSYSARPNPRTGRRPTGCPFCAGLKACKCNSLQTCYSQLALEWDFAKNEGTPDDHTAHSSYKAWWISAKHGSWQQSIFAHAWLIEDDKQRRFVKQHGL